MTLRLDDRVRVDIPDEIRYAWVTLVSNSSATNSLCSEISVLRHEDVSAEIKSIRPADLSGRTPGKSRRANTQMAQSGSI